LLSLLGGKKGRELCCLLEKIVFPSPSPSLLLLFSSPLLFSEIPPTNALIFQFDIGEVGQEGKRNYTSNEDFLV
jgi:hypothetical protein